MTDLPPVERLQAVALQPGDILVATVRHKVTAAEVEVIRAALADEFGGAHVVVVAGLDLAAYRPVDVAG